MPQLPSTGRYDRLPRIPASTSGSTPPDKRRAARSQRGISVACDEAPMCICFNPSRIGRWSGIDEDQSPCREPLMPLNVRPPMSQRLHIRPVWIYTQPSPTRNRVQYGGLALAVVAAGLLWRASFMPLPPMMSKYGGDALIPMSCLLHQILRYPCPSP